MKNIFYVLLAFMLIQVSCVKDPLEDIEEGGWNNERSILDIQFENQVGKPEVTRIDDERGEVEITINVDAVPDLSNIELRTLVLTYNATSSVNEGESLNFENAENSATIEVTSPTGKTREYKIIADSFQETLLGTYNVTDLVVWGGTGPEYGGGAVMAMMDKPWVWPETGGPGAELDNTVTFEMGGITEEGNTYGTIVNDAGEDGMYADFIFTGDPETDVNHFYRKIPKGEGEWLRNYATGTVSFTFDGKTTTGYFVEGGTEDLGWDKTKTTTDYALAFDLNGTDNWDKIYSDYDKFVARPRKFWIDLNKQ